MGEREGLFRRLDDEPVRAMTAMDVRRGDLGGRPSCFASTWPRGEEKEPSGRCKVSPCRSGSAVSRCAVTVPTRADGSVWVRRSARVMSLRSRSNTLLRSSSSASPV